MQNRKEVDDAGTVRLRIDTGRDKDQAPRD